MSNYRTSWSTKIGALSKSSKVESVIKSDGKHSMNERDATTCANTIVRHGVAGDRIVLERSL